jgi:hypothetical protein
MAWYGCDLYRSAWSHQLQRYSHYEGLVSNFLGLFEHQFEEPLVAMQVLFDQNL